MKTKKIWVPQEIYQLKVTLRNTRPPIWRRLLVPGGLTLDVLHDVLQTAIMMMAEINRKRKEGNPISYFGFTFPKILRIHREYRDLYPNGKLYIYELASFAPAMIGAIILAVCIRILG